MPNELPTLDLTLAIVTAVLAVRLVAMVRSRAAIEEFHRELMEHLEQDRLSEATEFAQGEDVPVHAAIAAALLKGALGHERLEPEPLRQELLERWRRARQLQHQRLSRSRARDLAGLALMIGAVAYAHVSGLDDIWFDILAAATCAILAGGLLARGGLLATSDRHQAALIDAVLAAHARHRGHPPCDVCGAELSPVDAPALASDGRSVALQELWSCKGCGAVRGQLAEPWRER